MAVGSWSSCSSCTSSLGSFDGVVVVKPPPDAAAEKEGGGGGAVKFLCSYGGRILPRHSDGALRYVGGDNRVLSVDRRCLRFRELLRRLGELCGWEVRQVRCQLPAEDLDALVSVTTDAELASLVEEYDAASQGRLRPLKIRAFLFPIRTAPEPSASPLPRGGSSPSLSASSGRTRTPPSPNAAARQLLRRQDYDVSWAGAAAAPPRWWEQAPAPRPARADLLPRPPQQCHRHGARPPQRWCLVHNGRHWQ
ncbi:hypothetical protein BS78_05G201400 [Paspalum vaginatum]|nr:hypothetical protein BS78_05G201400 [Paspalum vaginatum]